MTSPMRDKRKKCKGHRWRKPVLYETSIRIGPFVQPIKYLLQVCRCGAIKP